MVIEYNGTVGNGGCFMGSGPIVLFCLSFCADLNFFLHNVSAIVSYDRKELLDIRTAITNLDLDDDFYFNE
jgi:hypothetical protein